MAIYAIGDVQGCYEELSRLLDKINIDSATDELWFVGDLVNRGPRSLDVLRLVASLDNFSTVILGNHDLHLLALAFGAEPPIADDQLAAVLSAGDSGELLEWLRHRPLTHYRSDLNTLMVHAGVVPEWEVTQTVKFGREVESILQGADCGAFLTAMYGQRPDRWSSDLNGIDRLRFITNCLTRIRFCFADGRLEFSEKGPPGEQPDNLIPWFDLPIRATAEVRIVFGHWSALGLLEKETLLGIDTGCVWGRELTAVRLDGEAEFFSVNAC